MMKSQALLRMRIFSKEEGVAVSVILVTLFIVSFFNFKTALMRSRDVQRKNDSGDIIRGLEEFKSDFAFYPPSTKDGKISACNGGCVWGKDSLRDIADPNYPPYIKVLPADPDTGQGASYTYVSDGEHYQMFAALEGKDDAEYSSKIAALQIMCGVRVCNYGRASPGVPLDKTLQQYNNELELQRELLRKLKK